MEIDQDIESILLEIEAQQFRDYPESQNWKAFDSMDQMVAHLKKIGWLKS